MSKKNTKRGEGGELDAWWNRCLKNTKRGEKEHRVWRGRRTSCLVKMLAEPEELPGRKVYPLEEIIFLSVCAVLGGFEDWDEIAD